MSIWGRFIWGRSICRARLFAHTLSHTPSYKNIAHTLQSPKLDFAHPHWVFGNKSFFVLFNVYH